MFVASVRFELHIPSARSLKEKRAVVKPIVEGLRQRCHVAAAEVDHHDLWQRCSIGVAAVSGEVSQVEQLLDAAERFVWSFPEIEVSTTHRSWLEDV